MKTTFTVDTYIYELTSYSKDIDSVLVGTLIIVNLHGPDAKRYHHKMDIAGILFAYGNTLKLEKFVVEETTKSYIEHCSLPRLKPADKEYLEYSKSINKL